MEMNNNINSKIVLVLKEVKRIIRNLYGNSLIKAVLYGSYAKREENNTSDIDIAVIVKGNIRPYEELKKITNATFEIDLDYNVVLNFHPISEIDYQESKYSFLETIRDEGIIIQTDDKNKI